DSQSTSESESVTASVSTSTAWGITTSKATGDSESLARALQRSREFLVEQHELQQLPASAMIITYAGPAGRQVVMADTNPGIGGPGPVGWRQGRPPPNLGPPPQRLDWRKRRSGPGRDRTPRTQARLARGRAVLAAADHQAGRRPGRAPHRDRIASGPG